LKYRDFRDLITEKSDYENINFSIVSESNFFPGAANYIAEHESSLIVTVRYKKSFWKNISQRSHSKELAFYSTVPLLIIPGKNNSYLNNYPYKEASATSLTSSDDCNNLLGLNNPLAVCIILKYQSTTPLYK